MNFPDNPTDGQIFTYLDVSYIYNSLDSVWLLHETNSPLVKPTLIVSNVEPPDPKEGDLWLDSNDDVTYTFFNDEWIIVARDLTDSGVVAGTYGSSVYVPVITINSEGFITSANVVPVLGSDVDTYNSITDGVNTTLADGATTLSFNSFDNKLSISVDEESNVLFTVNENNLTLTNLSGNLDQSRITNLTTDLASKEWSVAVGTTGQYYRGDKTWQTLNSSAVGLGNVTNVDTTSATNITSGSLNNARLTDSGVTASTYNLPTITVNSKGIITSASSTTINTYSSITDGTNTATASGATAFKLRSADNKLSVVVGNDDPTHGDNVLLSINESSLTLTNLSGNLAQSRITNLTTDLASKEGTITPGTTGQYYRGDKTWQTLNSSSVGLGNVANVDTTSATNITSGFLANARLVSSGVTAGTYGDSSNIPVLTINSKGIITSASTIAVSGSGGEAGLSNAYSTITDGTNTATASGATAFKLRSVDNKLSVVVGNDDATHGDNVLLSINENNLTLTNLSGNLAQSRITNLTTDLASKEGTITPGTTGQYYRGDKTWQTLNSSAVGLGNVTNVNTAVATNISSGTLNAARLPTSGVTAATYGGSTSIPVIVVDGTGRITSASNSAISFYSSITDGTNTATASGATTFKLRSADNKLSVVVGNDDATHGDNALLTVNEGNLTLTNLSGNLAQSRITNLISDLGSKEGSVAAGTTGQYYRGDKTWQTLDKAAVGLGNVANVDTTSANSLTSGTLDNGRLTASVLRNDQAINCNNQLVTGQSVSVITDSGTSRSLSNSDNGTHIRFTNSGAITVTVPSGLTAGFNVSISQDGTGQITFAASGTTINNSSSHTKTRTTHSMAALIQLGTNIFNLSGDTAS